MIVRSLFDELTEKLNKDPRLTKRGGPRVDLSLFLFNARDTIRDLWSAADAVIADAKIYGNENPKALVSAVEKLRPIFGERK